VNVLVDTSVWSLALRRSSSGVDPVVQELRDLIDESRVQMIGPIRQEILSGIREQVQFDALRDTLRAFLDLEIVTTDFERAAEMFNLCRGQGVQGSNIDFLICAVAERLDLPILTTDKDFTLFQAHIPIRLHTIREAS
jgi:predicted nucleic acid-binding protein